MAVTTKGIETIITDRDPYRAYDWQVFVRAGGELRKGAMGRSSSMERSKRHITESLRELPAGVRAHGELLLTDVLNPDACRLIAVAARGRSGISWARV